MPLLNLDEKQRVTNAHGEWFDIRSVLDLQQETTGRKFMVTIATSIQAARDLRDAGELMASLDKSEEATRAVMGLISMFLVGWSFDAPLDANRISPDDRALLVTAAAEVLQKMAGVSSDTPLVEQSLAT